MANTYKNDKITKVHLNSTNSSTGEIVTTDIHSDTELTVEQPDGETDPDDASFFTVTRLSGQLVFADYDVFFTDTMSNGNTVETDMTSNTKVYIQIESEDGTWQDSQASTWFQVRVTTNPQNDVGSDDSLFKPTVDFTHSDHGGVQRPN